MCSGQPSSSQLTFMTIRMSKTKTAEESIIYASVEAIRNRYFLMNITNKSPRESILCIELSIFYKNE